MDYHPLQYNIKFVNLKMKKRSKKYEALKEQTKLMMEYYELQHYYVIAKLSKIIPTLAFT